MMRPFQAIVSSNARHLKPYLLRSPAQLLRKFSVKMILDLPIKSSNDDMGSKKHKIHSEHQQDAQIDIGDGRNMKCEMGYLTFLFMEPTQMNNTISKLEICLSNIDKRHKNLVIAKFTHLYKLRIMYSRLSKDAFECSVKEIEAMITPDECDMLKKEFASTVFTLLDASACMDSIQLLDYLEIIIFSKLDCHALWVSVVRRCLEGCKEYNLLQVHTLIRGISSITKSYNTLLRDTVVVNVSFKHEKLMTEIFTLSLTSKLIDHYTKLIEEAPTVEMVISPAASLMTFFYRYLKVGPLNNPKKNMFLDKFVVKIYNEFDKLSNDKLLTHYLFQCLLKAANFGQVNMILKYMLITMYYKINEEERRNVTPRMINTMGKASVYDGKLWKEYLREFYLNFKRKGELPMMTEVVTLFNYMIRLKIEDNEMLDMAIEWFNRHITTFEDIEKMSSFTAADIHGTLHFAILTNVFSKEQVQKMAKIHNYLSTHCICYTSRKICDHEPPLEAPQGFNGNLLPGGNQQPNYLISCITDVDIKKMILEQNNKPGVKEIQQYHDNYNERLVKLVIRNNLVNYFLEQFEFSDSLEDIQVCIYKWDGLFRFPSVPMKIGFEIVGAAYKTQDDKYFSKKNVKFIFLEKSGYLRVIINVVKQGVKNAILHTDMDAITSYLALEIQSQIKQQTGIVIPMDPIRREKYKLVVEQSGIEVNSYD